MSSSEDRRASAQPHEAQPPERGVTAWFVKNPIAANLIMLLLLIGGLLTTRDVKQEVFPEVGRNMVRVAIAYPGASPEEVEQGTVLAVEEAIRAVDGVEEIRARATEGQAMITADLLRGVNVEQALNDIKSEVDRITTFPQGAERPVITIPSNRTQVINIVIHGEQPLGTLKELAEDARRALLADPRISVVELSGVPLPEISIDASQEALRRYGLTLADVASAVQHASVDVPGGGIRTEAGEILIRTTERREAGLEFQNIEIRRQPDGSVVRVRDVATVRDAFRETDEAAFLNGEPAVRLGVFRIGEQTPVEVADVVKQYVQQQRGRISGVEYTLWDDQSEIYRSRVNLLLRNAAVGLILVLGILGLFLKPRLAFWVTLGIPISFLGAILFMPIVGVSVNMLSLFAFLLALGIVVDDAIVVGESVFAENRESSKQGAAVPGGKIGLRAAVVGTRKVAMPVVFAVLTTVAAFAPLLFLPDEAGEFYANIPAIVIPILILSLVEALIILPAHLAHSGNPSSPRRANSPVARLMSLQERFSTWFEQMVERRYRPLVQRLVRHRYVTLSAGVAVLLLAVGIVRGGFIKFDFMPKIEGDQVSASVQMPLGTSVQDTRAVAERLTNAAKAVASEFGDEQTRGIYTQVGVVVSGGGPDGPRQSTGSHVANVEIALMSADYRTFSSREFTRRWREKVGELAGPERLTFNYAIGPGSDAAYAVELRHPDRSTLRRAASEVAQELSAFAGVHDIDDGFSEGKPQFDVRLKPQARALGITEQDLAQQLRYAFFGAEAQRDQRGRDELRVYVRRPPEERASLYYLEQFLVRTPGGGEIPLQLAADIVQGESFTLIERENSSRAVDISAEVDIDVTSPNDVAAAIEGDTIPRLLQEYPGLTWERSGQQMRQDRSFAALSTGLSIALLVMYGLMAMAFRSYVQPVIILAAIPFGIVGALGGHLLLGYNLSLVSVLGMVALSGVVVNDSLVLIAAANDHAEDGKPVTVAVEQAGVDRFRAVLLTSLTTFAGLAPMILETSVQAQFLIPMALSLGFGVLFVTVIALGLVPALYCAVHDLYRLIQRAATPRDVNETNVPAPSR